MRVRLLASTIIDADVMRDEGFTPEQHAAEADTLAEFAGRGCYRSFHRPREATAANKDYLANILDLGHESVLEHSSATFHASRVSRSLLTELTRHRHLSFSVESQRYLEPRDCATFHPTIAYTNTDNPEFPQVRHILNNAYEHALKDYARIHDILVESGVSARRAREAARAVLPNATPVDMVVTGNLRAWRDVLRRRTHESADQELQEFAFSVLRELRVIAPATFQDM